MKTTDDSDVDLSDLWAKLERARVKTFAAQFYSPDYIEKYQFDTFDPSFANKLDLAFAALPPAEQFLRLPKGIVENTDNYLDENDLAKMLTWLGDHGKAQDMYYLDKVVDSQRTRAWGIAKRFNRVPERMRANVMNKLSCEEIERLRAVEDEERRKRAERRRMREKEVNERWRREGEKKEEQEKEENQEREREGKRIKMEEEKQGGGEVVELGAIPNVEVVPKVEAPAPRRVPVNFVDYRVLRIPTEGYRNLNRGFESVKTRIVEYESMRYEEGNNQNRNRKNKTYLNDFMKDVGERVDGCIRKTFWHLKSHMRWEKVVDWRLWRAAVAVVLDVLEYVYLPVEHRVITDAGEEQVKTIDASDELRAYGAKKKLGDWLLKLFFETGVDKAELVRWLKSEGDLHLKLGMLLEKMTRSGMDRTMMQKIARPFGI